MDLKESIRSKVTIESKIIKEKTQEKMMNILIDGLWVD